MNKIVLSLICLSGVSLYGMEQVKEASLKEALQFDEILINAIAREADADYWYPASVASQIGAEYKKLKTLKQEYPEEFPAYEKSIKKFNTKLYELYDLLTDALTAQVEELEDSVIEYQALTDAEKAQQQASLFEQYDAVNTFYNAMVDTTMADALSRVDNDLPGIHAKLVAARRALDIE